MVLDVHDLLREVALKLVEFGVLLHEGLGGLLVPNLLANDCFEDLIDVLSLHLLPQELQVLHKLWVLKLGEIETGIESSADLLDSTIH